MNGFSTRTFEDLISQGEKSFKDLLALGYQWLEEDTKKNPGASEVKQYEDKNRYMERVNRIGQSVAQRRNYAQAERFYLAILGKLEGLESRTSKKFNKGIIYGSIGVYQLAQGKMDQGMFNLHRGFEDDRPVLKLLGYPETKAEEDLVGSRLYTQFEDWEKGWLRVLLDIKDSNDLDDLFETRSPGKRLFLFAIVKTLSINLENNKTLTNIFSRGRILGALRDLGLWVEDELKKKHEEKHKEKCALMLLGLLKEAVREDLGLDGNLRLQSRSLPELEGNLKKSWKNKSIISSYQTLVLVRNLSSHNYLTEESWVFQNAEEVARKCFFAIFDLRKRGKI